ncbi:50S ribosomal protein L11 methyltransferase [Brumimicrobium glaciale]|uniref:50S ribosomal protein L11 methyltransferase n=1 Tax=Brumimicrobium glaciale TaxID=200475 RepID=A0A4Q4KHS0_9FLAO|nr:50S ribosomal protein L11 methyltransferase [Brumimicrobium glaciale]RYM32742.1 50S ribosomal protein L11 methyltransferase [Brumimicrobium glaciale]
MDYIQITLDIWPKQPWTEIITQELAGIDFDSFTEEDKLLQAYVSAENFNEKRFNALIEEYKSKDIKIAVKQDLIPSQNWNAVWESDYDPVTVDKSLLIRAPFHSEDKSFELSIEIQPQMSFGTGHHQTTYLLSKHLLAVEFKNKKVLDVGTGTGVLGIIASKLGAEKVFGTDIEEGAVENAIENCERNSTQNFTIIKGDIDLVPNEKYDIVIANINKNVLKRHMEEYAKLTKEDGLLFLSGFFETDISELSAHAALYKFETIETFTKETWAVIKLLKTK